MVRNKPFLSAVCALVFALGITFVPVKPAAADDALDTVIYVGTHSDYVGNTYGPTLSEEYKAYDYIYGNGTTLRVNQTTYSNPDAGNADTWVCSSADGTTTSGLYGDPSTGSPPF